MQLDELRLQDIALSELHLVKAAVCRIGGRDHSRWVFADARDPDRRTAYFKVWNPDYVRRNNVQEALESGFYDESIVGALRALIFHRGICRGYVTHACRITLRLKRDFLEMLRRRTLECNYFAIQYGRFHIGLYGGRYSLFDLEGVYRIEDLPVMASLDSFFDDRAYGHFVAARFLKLYPDRAQELGAREFLRTGVDPRALRGLVTDLLPPRLVRAFRVRRHELAWKNRQASHTSLIEL